MASLGLCCSSMIPRRLFPIGANRVLWRCEEKLGPPFPSQSTHPEAEVLLSSLCCRSPKVDRHNEERGLEQTVAILAHSVRRPPTHFSGRCFVPWRRCVREGWWLRAILAACVPRGERGCRGVLLLGLRAAPGDTLAAQRERAAVLRMSLPEVISARTRGQVRVECVHGRELHVC